MRYDDFRDRLHGALGRERLPTMMTPVDKIDLGSAGRSFKVYMHAFQDTEPFHCAASVKFRWSPFEAARSYTCEEDLLTELYGRRSGRKLKTEPRLVRVDLELYASLMQGSIAPTPPPKILDPWTRTLGRRLEPFLPDSAYIPEHPLDVYAGRLPLEVRSSPSPDGTLTLSGISMRAFQFVQVPRVLDTPDRRHKEKDPGRQLKLFARRCRDAFQAWSDSIKELAPRIDYTPPPSERLVKE